MVEEKEGILQLARQGQQGNQTWSSKTLMYWISWKVPEPHYRARATFHRILKCFILVDLKREEAGYEDVDQMRGLTYPYPNLQSGSKFQSAFMPNALRSTFGYFLNKERSDDVNLFSGWMTLSKYFMQQRWMYSIWNSCSLGTTDIQGKGGLLSSFGLPGKFLFQSRLWCAQ